MDLTKIKKPISDAQNYFVNYFNECFSDKKKTFKFLALFIFTILFLIQVGIMIFRNSFYTNFSDDILQYYTIMVDFVASVKDGSLSLFNLNNYLGASFFSDIYYIPLDIFTLLTYVLSYLMPTEIAYSIMELFKIFIGVMAFAYYFHLKGYKNRTIFWMGVVYLVSGGMVSFMAFPAFLSIIFYAPLALIVIHYFYNKKRWMLPLYAFIVIFYDFYLAYMLLAFISFAFILEYFKHETFNFGHLIRDGLIFLGLLLLGVLMASVVLLPSISFILEETYRPQATFKAWIINIGSYELKLFQPNIYIRYLAKIFAEQKPIGFYGFESDYGLEHASLYITVIGFVYMCNVFFMKDRISRIYKYTFIIILIFMIFPLFSYVFSGTLDKPYTRWVNLIPIIQIMALAHVFDNHGFEKIKMKNMTIIIGVMLVTVSFLIYYYIDKLSLGINYAGKATLTADTVLLCISGAYLIALLVFGWLKKFRYIKLLFWVEVVIAIGYIYSGPFSISNKNDAFREMYEINDFLEENISKDEFARVYVDFSRFNVEKTNFNRMTSFPTNTFIFHSWTDSETDSLAKMIFNLNEYQSKDRLNHFGLYLNHFLGYKYVLVNNEFDFVFDNEYFTFIASESKYSLYELNFASNFRVYDSYMYYKNTDPNSFSLEDLSANLLRQKYLMLTAVVDIEDNYDFQDYNIPYFNTEIVGSNQFLVAFETISGDLETRSGFNDETIRNFYVYDEADLDIDVTLGAMYIKFENPYNAVTDLKEVFLEYGDNTKQSCRVYKAVDSDDASKTAFHIKCEFVKKPIKLLIEQTPDILTPPNLKLRMERVIGMDAFLTYDLSDLTFPGESGHMILDTTIDKGFERVFVTDKNGTSYECLNGYCYYGENGLDKLYFKKTGKMYSDVNDFFYYRPKYLIEDSDVIKDFLVQDNITDKFLSIKNGRISLEYSNKNLTDKDQIVVVPVAYSEDWQFTTDIKYDTISVNGGFLGIVVPKGTLNININMKFMPKYLDLGLYASLAGISIYCLIFFVPLLIERKKRIKL